MRTVVTAIESEYRTYKKLVEGVLAQLSDDELHARPGDANSVAILLQHIGGNLNSRFTDFLTSDGEKAWRDRESEFAERPATRSELLEIWEDGWRQLFGALATLDDDQLNATVRIRSAPLSVIEALTRSLAHTTQHAGQIVLLGRIIRGGEWKFLTIPPGQSNAFNAKMKKV